jgi:hypothetical protein
MADKETPYLLYRNIHANLSFQDLNHWLTTQSENQGVSHACFYGK